uniref:(California timema) hypothetical protein n=1 Tax=Timema californicum TaxID=61474 RepID=A0A7R9J0S4_TIMCA|nr:unnamed protein product [Timema californicum]
MTERSRFESLSGKMNTATASFMRPFCKKWKAKSIFQVLLMYRSARYQDLVYFSQQVHLYNQKAMSGLQASNVEVILEKVDPGGRASLVLPKKRQSVWKLPFRLDDLPFFDTTFMCDPLAATGLKGCTSGDNDQESWDAPLRRGQAGGWRPSQICMKDQESQTNSTPDNSDKCVGADEDFIQIPYNRDPKLIADKEWLSGSVQQKRDYNQTSQRKTTYDSPSNAQNYDYSRGVYKGIRKEPTSDAKNNRQFLRSDLPQPYRKKTSTVQNNSYGPVNNNDRYSRDLDNNPSDASDSWDLPRTSSYGAKNEYNRVELKITIIMHKIEHETLSGPLGHVGGENITLLYLVNNGFTLRTTIAASKVNITGNCLQAMLRKTKINRASLRRGSDQALSSDMASNAQHIVSSNKSTDKRRGGTVVYNSSIISDSPPPRYGCLNPWHDNKNKRIIEEMGAEEGSEEESEGISVVTTTTMLAPGLVVQGQVAEL